MKIVEATLESLNEEPDVKYTRVTIRPGDFGTKYLPVQNANREIDTKWAKKLWENWPSVEGETILVLYQDPKDAKVYRIIDGQHRIYAASKWLTGKKEATLEAQIRPSPVGGLKAVANQISHLNLGKRYRTQDHLANTRSGSLWPDIFRAQGLEPVYTRSGPKFSWPSIIGGYLASKGMTSVKATSAEEQLDAWLMKDPNEILWCAKTLSWWKTACDGASKTHRLYTLQSLMGIAFALKLCRENQGKMTHLSSVPSRLLMWPELPSVRGFTAARGALLPEALLKGVNFRLHSENLLTYNGKTGRETP
jgi:hypothetical protein